jgi:sarcosine oxidase delta subunit
MLRGGVNTELHTPYSVPSWNTELEVLYWLAEQNQFERDDALAQAVAMVNGIWISLGTDDVQQAVYSDCNDMLNFLRDTNELQKTWGASQLEDYPLDALAALAWSGNDLGRGGHIHYCLISDKSCQPSHYPLNIHHFIENIDRQVTLKDYRWNTVSVQTLRQLQQTVVQRPWLGQDANVTADNLENYFYVGPNNRGFSFAHWNFTEPNDEFINVNGEQTIDHNMNNANFEYQYFTKTDGGIGVCDDNMTLINAFLKSCGVASTALTRTYGIVNGLNHTHAIYYDPSSDSWKGAQGELLIGFTDTGFSTNWNVYIARPPILQHNYFNSEPDSKQKFMIMLDIYYKMLGVDSDQITSMFTSGVPTSTTHDWFLTLH